MKASSMMSPGVRAQAAWRAAARSDTMGGGLWPHVCGRMPVTA